MENEKNEKERKRTHRLIDVNSLLSGIVAGLVGAVLLARYNQPVYIAIPIVIILYFIVYWFSKKYPEQTSNTAWIILFIAGILTILSSYQQEFWSNLTWRMDVVALGTGILSISIGTLAMNISLKSDKRITAIADMQFYEKMAVIQTYLKSVNPNDSDKYDADRIFYDLKAAKQLEKWVSSPEIAKMLNSEIQILIDATLSGQKYEHLIERLQQIKEGDC